MSNSCKLLSRYYNKLHTFYNFKSSTSVQLFRSVYSGPESTKNFAKEHCFGDSWEEKKLAAIREKVIKSCQGEFEDKILDEGTRVLYDLPHLITTDQPKKYHVEGFKDKMLGNVVESDRPSQIHETNIDEQFARPEVQEILLKITGKSTEKVFTRKLGDLGIMPAVRYLTSEQLEAEYSKSMQEADNILEMPPVMKKRKNIDEILANDTELNGYEDHNIVFMDISEDKKERERFVVVREPTGVLRKAFWEERERIMQIYFPKEGRKIITPTIFKNIENALENHLHINVMENILIQFEPDSAEFIDLCQQVYDHINEKELFDIFRSTRFFGGMAFYLTQTKNIDGMLKEMINKSLLSDAASLVKLYCLLHPKCKTAKIENISDSLSDKQVIQGYISNDAKNKKELKNCLELFLHSTSQKNEEIS